jgi:clusterin-associated protein 1
MSYRDLRNFTEMMRGLGYTRLISMENFRTPNFPLVAEVLVWLVKRYDPNSDIPTDIDTAQDRVIFIKSVALFMNSKAHIKLNMKKLYQADGYAVKELLKVTSLLYNAVRTSSTDFKERPGDSADDSTVTFDISSKVQDIKEARSLASDITTKGASLYDLLGKEVDLREARSNVIARQLEINEVEKSLLQSIKAVEADIKKTQLAIENVASDEANLEEKIKKKKSELERNQKRLETLQSVRPAYMDEYEKLEEDLQHIYDDYMLKFRNQAYLESVLDEYHKAEADETETLDLQMRKVSNRIRETNSNRNKSKTVTSDDEDLQDDGNELNSDGLSGDDSDVEDMQPTNTGMRQDQRPVHTRQRQSGAMMMTTQADVVAGSGKPVVRGSMGMDELELDGDDDDDEESGSSIEIDDDDDSEDGEAANEMANVRGGRDPRTGAQQQQQQQQRGRGHGSIASQMQPDIEDDDEDDDEDF